MTVLRRVLLAALFALLGARGAWASDQPYVLADTRVIGFTAKDRVHALTLFVSLPRNYEKRTAERFPVIYLLDADYAFPITRTVLRHFADRSQIAEAIIVGIAYPGADDDLDIYKHLRVRDYTPTHVMGASGYGPDADALSGGAADFLHVLSDELLPMIDAKYRTDPAARMIVGHSFGGLFETYAMFTRPGLFRDYLIVSPSYWYDNGMIFALAHDYMAKHKNLAAHVFYGVGSFEGQGSMAADMKTLDSELIAAHLPGYESILQVFDGDTHNSVFPAAVTRGLRVLYNFKGENGPVVAPGSVPAK